MSFVSWVILIFVLYVVYRCYVLSGSDRRPAPEAESRSKQSAINNAMVNLQHAKEFTKQEKIGQLIQEDPGKAANIVKKWVK